MHRPPWRLRTRTLTPEAGALVMGIVNVTPDSFSDGGTYLAADAAIRHGMALHAEGADIVDVGGESTRPGSRPVSAAEEIDRVLPVVTALAAAGITVSIDTAKAEVAAAALEAGAEAVNDVTAMRDPSMPGVVADTGAGLVLMHMAGTPATMQQDPVYEDVVAEVNAFLGARVEVAIDAGIDRSTVCIDPGIGFGKTLVHNLELLAGLGTIAAQGLPVLVGVSRKAFLGALIGRDEPRDRDLASAVVAGIAVGSGATIIRAHDVTATRQAVVVAGAIVRSDPMNEATPW